MVIRIIDSLTLCTKYTVEMINYHTWWKAACTGTTQHTNIIVQSLEELLWFFVLVFILLFD